VAGKKPRGIDREIAELAPAEADPAGEGVRERIARALLSKHGHVVARAATVIKEHRLADFGDPLRAAYARLREEGAKVDPGCHGKVALLEALDYTEDGDPAPFLDATRVVQMEPAMVAGGREDTAHGVRVRGALGLVRLRHEDVLLVCGRLLGDPAAVVRQAAADALAHHGARDGAALLLLRIAAGEPDPAALAEEARALVLLAPDEAAPVLRPMLGDGRLRELIAHAMVQAGTDAALGLILAELEATPIASDRAVLLRALGVSRQPRARQHLLGLVAEGGVSDAPAAVRALAVHRYDPRLAAEVRERAAQNPNVDLHAVVAEAFP
jgi:hypothetical protein